MIGDGVPVRLERALFLRGRTLPAQLIQKVCGAAQARIGGDQALTGLQPRVARHHARQRAEQAFERRLSVHAQRGEAQAQGIDGPRVPRGSLVQQAERERIEHALFADGGLEAVQGRGVGQSIVQQELHQHLEADLRRQLLHGVACNGEASQLAFDPAQPGLGGEHAFQPGTSGVGHGSGDSRSGDRRSGGGGFGRGLHDQEMTLAPDCVNLDP